MISKILLHILAHLPIVHEIFLFFLQAHSSLLGYSFVHG